MIDYFKIVNLILNQVPESVVSLTPTRKTKAYLVTMPSGAKFILKKAKKQEILNHTSAFRAKLKAPKIIGFIQDANLESADFWFIQEYIQSETLETKLTQYKSVYIPLFKKSIDLLIEIQTALNFFEKDLGTPLRTLTNHESLSYERFSQKTLEPIMQALDKYRDQTWAENGTNIINTLLANFTKIYDLLITQDEKNVLVKWDFKPNNILVTKSEELFCIDWDYIGKGSCLIDLAFLIYDLDTAEKKQMFEYYCAKSIKFEYTYAHLVAAEILVGLAHLKANCFLVVSDLVNEENYLQGIKHNLIKLQNLLAEI